MTIGDEASRNCPRTWLCLQGGKGGGGSVSGLFIPPFSSVLFSFPPFPFPSCSLPCEIRERETSPYSCLLEKAREDGLEDGSGMVGKNWEKGEGKREDRKGRGEEERASGRERERETGSL